MHKKLQVFVSSTFVDLKEERQAAVAGILLAGHIPAGMELFTAGDEAQLEVIKRWIRDSDVYMLILGARYGSVDPKSGLSYTEFEYDYARELGKPIFATVMSGALYEQRRVEQESEESAPIRTAYETFRAKVLGKISSPFENSDQLKLGILAALRDIGERPNLTGWIRSSDVSDVQPLVEEIAKLQAERDELKTKLMERGQTPVFEGRTLAGLDDAFNFSIEYKVVSNGSKRTSVVQATWGEIFGLVAPLLMQFPVDSAVNSKVADYLLRRDQVPHFSGNVEENTWGTVKMHLEALGLVDLKYLQSMGGGMNLYWYATAAGKQVGMALRAVYRSGANGDPS